MNARNSPKRAPRTSVSRSRLVAYDVLRDVTERDAYANLALQSRIRAAALDTRDAALATELAAGALRGLGRYDRIIEVAARRPIDEIDDRTRNVLRLGTHQLLSMRTAAHAAVNESVELQRHVAQSAAAGFVNGVLRTIGRTSAAEWDRRISATEPNADAAFAARLSHPAWVVRAFRDALRAEGREGELEALLEANNAAPRVHAVLLPGLGVAPEQLVENDRPGLPSVSLQGPSPLGLQLAGGDPARLVAAWGLADGAVRVQDQGSQLAALALTRVSPVTAGERWLDLCAGPGGKTAILGAEAMQSGATVRANEVSEHRAELVWASTVAVSPVVEVVCHDGRSSEAFGGEDAMYDRILVDAPCTGLGALRRRPEARWRKSPEDLPELTKLQTELLGRAVRHVKPGGYVAYVTCSPHLAETRVILDRILRSRPDLVELDARAVITRIARVELDLSGDALSVQLWPHRHDTDAMFISLIQRSR